MRTIDKRTIRAVLKARAKNEKSTVTAERLGLSQQQVAAINSNYSQGRYDYWLNR